ncbi:MAG: ALG6, ALG8 glycosyltransferase family-domain-containing protein [Olpidium bornovanus]|uniref:Alpha-1,3-glucosyltransferase n=1 Tax=Olpidium bornovanus TaxID=278681 RepID=A0A8H8DJI5_9FUNG|nr:MAG: ALG6, ALG8 glycosyltransferase family-domain-containing protein [Olpidium bornovanus]
MWCAMNVIVKLRQVFEQKHLVLLSLIATLLVIGPACVHLAIQPGRRRMLYAMASCSLGFFLCSFQVHEKSILIPALPVTLLMAIGEPMDFAWGGFFINAAMFRYALFGCCVTHVSGSPMPNLGRIFLHSKHVPPAEERRPELAVRVYAGALELARRALEARKKPADFHANDSGTSSYAVAGPCACFQRLKTEE